MLRSRYGPADPGQSGRDCGSGGFVTIRPHYVQIDCDRSMTPVAARSALVFHTLIHRNGG